MTEFLKCNHTLDEAEIVSTRLVPRKGYEPREVTYHIVITVKCSNCGLLQSYSLKVYNESNMIQIGKLLSRHLPGEFRRY